MEAVRRHNTPRFIYISTDEVYGSTSDGVFIEESPLRPSNPYSTSKAGADLIVQSYIKTFRVPAIIIRPSNNYGTHQYPEKLIPLAITNFVEKRKIPVHGSGEHVRSWLHVEDLCSAIDLIAHEAPEFGIYNVSGEERTNLEVLKLLANFLRLDLNSYIYHVNDRPSADIRYAPDSTKLQKELGWFRKNNLESSTEKIVRWYLDNLVWWQKLKQKKEYLDHYEKQSKAQWY
jgi:dTDP-glucose 4,6-dehydratase